MKKISRAERAKKSLTAETLRFRLLMSLVGIAACFALMLSSAYALFQTGISNSGNKISSASYSISVASVQGVASVSSDSDTQSFGMAYVCPLAANDYHIFRLTASGTENTAGYCKVTVGTNVYYTKPINSGEELVLMVQAARGTPIIFAPCWGNLPEGASYSDSPIIHSTTPNVSYTPRMGETVATLAAYISIPAEDILVYNNIAELQAGKEIKIPCRTEEVGYYVIRHQIQSGETLLSIANKYGFTVAQICVFNGTTQRVPIVAGATLNIPLPGFAITQTQGSHIIVDGDTLKSIADRYSLTVQNLRDFNPSVKDSDIIYIGEILKIPTLEEIVALEAAKKAAETTTPPETTTSPETTPSPESTISPEITTTPETTTSPEITTSPETITSPETTTSPEIITTPETTTAPETTSTPIPPAESST